MPFMDQDMKAVYGTWINMRQLLELTTISRAFILKSIQNGSLKAHKVGKSYRFNMTDVDAFIDTLRVNY